MMKKLIILSTLLIVLTFSAITASAAVSSWAQNDFNALKQCGIITNELESKNQESPIKRSEFAHLIYNAYLQNNTRVTVSESPFGDANAEYLSALYQLGIIKGDEKQNFNGEDPITRQEACVILSNFFKVYEKKGLLPVETSLNKYKDVSTIASWAMPYAAQLSFLDIIQGSDGYFMPNAVVTIEQAYCFINRIAKLGQKKISLNQSYDGKTIYLNWSGIDSSEYKVHVITTRNTRHFDETGTDIKIHTTNNKNFAINTDYVRTYEIIVTADGYTSNKVTVNSPKFGYYVEQTTEIHEANKNLIREYYENLNNQKRAEAEARGEEYTDMEIPQDKTMPTTKEEADYLQKTIEIPVWKMGWDGSKYQSTMEITVHKQIADKMYNAFKEIFEGEEKFPIDYLCYYAWRGDGGEHNIGTAIDINPTQNYCIYSNGTIVGDYWKPYDDPFSITPFGEVMKAFERNGFNWGGDTWRNNRDYMHFSYMGGW